MATCTLQQAAKLRVKISSKDQENLIWRLGKMTFIIVGVLTIKLKKTASYQCSTWANATKWRKRHASPTAEVWDYGEKEASAIQRVNSGFYGDADTYSCLCIHTCACTHMLKGTPSKTNCHKHKKITIGRSWQTQSCQPSFHSPHCGLVRLDRLQREERLSRVGCTDKRWLTGLTLTSIVIQLKGENSKIKNENHKQIHKTE